MSEEISELHKHSFYGFKEELLNMAKTKNQPKPQRRPADNTSRELLVREDSDDRPSQPLSIGLPEATANLGPILAGTPYAAEELESAVIPRKLRHLGALKKIVSHYGIDSEKILVRLA